MDIGTTIVELRQLTLDDRRRVMRELWQTLPADYPASLFSEEELAEFQRRLDAYRANPESGASWPEVRKAAQERHLPCPSE